MDDSHNPHLSDYITRSSIQSPGFKHYGLPRKRKKTTQVIATIVGICIFIWVAYESVLAIGTMAN